MADATPNAGASTTPPPAPPPAEGGTPPADGTALGGAAPNGQNTPPPATPQGASPPAPEIEFKVPDGLVADTGLIERFKPMAKELKLDSGGAQKLVDLYADAVKTNTTKAIEAHTQRVQEWLQACKTDKDFGGANFDTNLSTALRAVERFGGAELRDILNQSGLGNNPALFKAFVKIGKAISEDKVGDAGTQPAKVVPSDAEILAKRYPSMFNPDGTPK